MSSILAAPAHKHVAPLGRNATWPMCRLPAPLSACCPGCSMYSGGAPQPLRPQCQLMVWLSSARQSRRCHRVRPSRQHGQAHRPGVQDGRQRAIPAHAARLCAAAARARASGRRAAGTRRGRVVRLGEARPNSHPTLACNPKQARVEAECHALRIDLLAHHVH